MNNEIKPMLINNLKKMPFDSQFLIDIQSGLKLTYAQFFQRVLLISDQIKKAMSKEFILVMSNGRNLVASYFALIFTECTVIPVDPLKGSEEFDEIFNQHPYAKIITDVPSICCSQSCRLFVLDFGNEAPEAAPPTIWEQTVNSFENSDFDRLFLVTYTSGTSGRPKGVCHTLSNLFHSAFSFGEKFSFNFRHNFAHCMPMTYMAGILNTIFLPFVFGCRITLLPRFSITNAMRFWQSIQAAEANVFWLSPIMLSVLIKLDPNAKAKKYLHESGSIFCVGTAPLPQILKSNFEAAYGISIYQSYGLSETLFVSTNHPGIKHDADSVGEIINGCDVKIDIDGEILINAPWMFMHYSNEPTLHYFQENYYRTGDLGVVSEKQFLSITGRKKELIIKGGINISPVQIEKVIEPIDGIDDVIVFAYLSNQKEELIGCGYVLNTEHKQLDFLSVNTLITEKLGAAYRIDRFIQLSSVPLNINGKKDRRSSLLQEGGSPE